MKIIVAGGRDFVAEQKHEDWLIETLKTHNATEVVCGMARGADMFGYHVAKNLLGLPVKEFPAKWKLLGNSAGPIRNEEMAKYADMCVLFPGDRGTASMRSLAKQYGLKVIEYL